MPDPSPPALRMPPFSEVLKSREVEDPVNLWVHRPLAYGFCWLVFRTPITPNQITVLAMLLGFGAAGCWFDGGRSAMIWGGVLLWSSAIMDGADGILARAKKMQSAFGRALDGSADFVVTLSTIVACIYHLHVTGMNPMLLILLAAVAIGTSVVQFNSYDLYKEIYVHRTRLDKQREGNSPAEVEVLRSSAAAKNGAWYTRLSLAFYADYLKNQDKLVSATNPAAKRLLGDDVARSEESAAAYRRYNALPMRLWMALSTAPHAYLFSIFGMFDRLDLYLWLRVTMMNAVMLLAFIVQRRTTRLTIEDLIQRGMLR